MEATLYIFLLTSVAVSRCQFNLGLCRPHLVQGIFDDSVTLKDLVLDGDYTVMYTSGLKQYDNVACARMGYNWHNSSGTSEYYVYIDTGETEELHVYKTDELRPGIITMHLKKSGSSKQFIVYREHGILLIYWCLNKDNDNFNNNIWVIAAKTSLVKLWKTKKAVLQMLYHDDYRHLIDKDTDDSREEAVRFLELPLCEEM
ncbi:uncharacterized protein LOC124357114 [Homalodisca vitripennis]|uniref:uncharacterized protein LOC124357114 n=1 Tax=Homalodisca vitripennis TaxID=197043 RepID=UPI001EEBD667|nr:uncharacterized protein LOC124357114 [Homalodisca vitripennis]